MDKKEKELLRAQEDAAFRRILLWLVGAIPVEALLLFGRRYRVDFTNDEIELALHLVNFCKVLTIVALIAAVGCAVWGVLRFRQKKSALYPAALAIFALAVSLAAWIIKHDGYGSKISLAMVFFPCVALLAIIYYLYQAEFLFAAAATAAQLLGVRIFTLGGAHKSLIFAALLIFVAAIAVVVILAGRSKGKLGPVQVFSSKKVNYLLLYITCALMLLLLLLSYFLCGKLPVAVLYAPGVAWLFILAVYYTVRLM